MPERVIPCPHCNGKGACGFMSGDGPDMDQCPMCEGFGTIPDRRAVSAAERALRHLLNCLNAVTCKHRHGQPISKRRLDDLSNAQVEYEEASRG